MRIHTAIALTIIAALALWDVDVVLGKPKKANGANGASGNGSNGSGRGSSGSDRGSSGSDRGSSGSGSNEILESPTTSPESCPDTTVIDVGAIDSTIFTVVATSATDIVRFHRGAATSDFSACKGAVVQAQANSDTAETRATEAENMATAVEQWAQTVTSAVQDATASRAEATLARQSANAAAEALETASDALTAANTSATESIGLEDLADTALTSVSEQSDLAAQATTIDEFNGALSAAATETNNIIDLISAASAVSRDANDASGRCVSAAATVTQLRIETEMHAGAAIGAAVAGLAKELVPNY